MIQLDKLAGDIIHRGLRPGEAPTKIGAEIVDAPVDCLETPVVEVHAECKGKHGQADGNEQLNVTHGIIVPLSSQIQPYSAEAQWDFSLPSEPHRLSLPHR